MVITLTADNFEKEVLNATTPVLVDFWADWCGPCRQLSPVVEDVSKQVSHCKIGKVNVDEQPELAGKFGIMSIPTLILFRDGKTVEQTVGTVSKQQIMDMLR